MRDPVRLRALQPQGQHCNRSQRGPSRLLLLAIAKPCLGCKHKHGQGSLLGTSQPPKQGTGWRGYSLPSPTPAQDCRCWEPLLE